MTDIEQRKAAKAFAEQWKDKGYEKGESQTFWLQLLQDVFEVENVSQFIRFEDTVHIDKATGFIDAFIDKTKVLIEQKSIDKDLRKAIKQSDGSLLNPFQQAKRYSAELPYDDRPRWIITCNFKSFLVYDMNNPNGEPEEILLKDLPKEYYRLQFLVDSKSDHIKKEEELSFKAGELVGKIYDEILPLYKNPENEEFKKYLDDFFVSYLEEDQLSVNIFCEDPSKFGLEHYEAEWYSYETFGDDEIEHDLNLFKEMLAELEAFKDAQLNDLQESAYKTIESFLNYYVEYYSIEDSFFSQILYVDQFGGYVADFGTYMEAYSLRSELEKEIYKYN